LIILEHIAYYNIAYDAQIELDIEPEDKVTRLHHATSDNVLNPPVPPSSITFVATIMRRCGYDDQITRIKEKVEEQSGVPPPQQRLIFSGRQL